MTVFTTDSAIFMTLKPTVSFARLYNLVDAANSNPFLNALLSNAASDNEAAGNGPGQVVFRLMNNEEQGLPGASTPVAFFKRETDGDGNYNIALNQNALVIGGNWIDVQVAGYVAHELQHYADRSLFAEANRWTNDSSFHPEETNLLARFENYMRGTLEAEARGWYEQVKTVRSEINAEH